MGTKSPPHPPQCAHWGTFPPRGRLWGWVLSFRVSTVPPIYPAGHASQSFPARRRGKKLQSCFDRRRRPKHTSHPESAGSAGAVRGASPNFGSPAQRVPKFLPFPARPAGGRAVTNVGLWAAGQSRNIEKTSPWPPTRERWVQGGENLSPPWCSFLRLSSKESRAPPRSSAGETTLQGPPCAGPEEPSNERGAAPRGNFRGTHP